MGIIEKFGDFISDAANMVKNITAAITSFFSLFNNIVSFLPAPFGTILTFFAITIVGIILFKIAGDFI